jgi:hypothetical protein
MTIEQDLKRLQDRVSKLEKAVFQSRKCEQKAAPEKESFKGATGGVRLLLSKGFFRTRRRLGEITASLKKDGYLYSTQAFQEALKRLSKPSGPLVSVRENGAKVYAERK